MLVPFLILRRLFISEACDCASSSMQGPGISFTCVTLRLRTVVVVVVATCVLVHIGMIEQTFKYASVLIWSVRFGGASSVMNAPRQTNFLPEERIGS